MPDQLFTYYIGNPLVIISINSGSWDGCNGYLARDRNVGNVKVALKVGVKRRGWVGKRYGDCWVCDPCVYFVFPLL
jgi:hypothetical protein